VPHSIGSRSLPPVSPTTAGRELPSEPCLSCGEETAVGSVFFSDRSTIERADSQSAFLCSLCDARLRVSRKGAPLTDEEVRNLVKNGTAIALGWRP
jgi:hypothetical protein